MLRSTNLPKAQVTPPAKGSDFSGNNSGIDLRTGARLDRKPLSGVALEKTDDGYKQVVSGKTYYYDENKVLQSVNSNGNTILEFYSYGYDEYEYNYNGEVISDVEHIINGEIRSCETPFYTYEVVNGHELVVFRDKNGNVVKYYETEENRIVWRKADGSLERYHDGKYRNPDGTIEQD